MLRCKRKYLDRLPRKVLKKAKFGGVIFGLPLFPSFFLLNWLGSTVNILVHEVSRDTTDGRPLLMVDQKY